MFQIFNRNSLNKNNLVFFKNQSILWKLELPVSHIKVNHISFYEKKWLKNFFGHTTGPVRSFFTDQGSKLCPLYWKHGVLTTGPPGKFLIIFTIAIFLSYEWKQRNTILEHVIENNSIRIFAYLFIIIIDMQIKTTMRLSPHTGQNGL